ncbi:phage holin family protein [Marivirga sp. S37H4]|uniref:Phage holin family protein n=1 Tax=Marivirga aurantiaca TaxID=2802615 RepID=A0A935C8G6_9BACT|nr:phage holin family protein [Marivirga aurantiaca]MBK6265601.1 phage holin family protein [Marivirga aurantiaca]
MKNKLLGLLGVDKLIDTIQRLIEVRVSMIRNEIKDKIKEGIEKAIPLILLFVSISVFVLFASFTLAFYLSSLFDSLVYGFGCVSLIYLMLSLLFFLLKKSEKIKNKIRSEIDKRN